jgi:hypothetical protein
VLDTFAHLLINQLVVDCGYGTPLSASACTCPAPPRLRMAAVLIYTAAGDAEGTMGDLARMGQPGKLEPAIFRTKPAW